MNKTRILSFDYILQSFILSLTYSLLVTGMLQAEGINTETASGIIKGDANFDGEINTEDADAFIIGMMSEEVYKKQYGYSPKYKCDIDNNDFIDFDDILGFVRLHNPQRPDKNIKLTDNDTLTKDSLSLNVAARILTKDTLVIGNNVSMSENGRYVTMKSINPYHYNAMNPITIFDTFSETEIKISLPEKYKDFHGFYFNGTDISANGKYVALTLMKYTKNDSGEYTDFTSHVLRYDLTNGDMVEVSDAPLSMSPSISEDGSKIVFLSVLQDPNYLHIQVKDLNTGNTLTLGKVEMFTGLSFRPAISKNGKFVVTPMQDDETLYGVAFSLFNAENGKLIREYVSQDTPYNEFEIYNTPSITSDGQYVFFSANKKIKDDSGRTKENIGMFRFDNNTEKLDFIVDEETLSNFSALLDFGISSDGTFLTIDNTIFNLAKKEKADIKITSESWNSFFNYISGDGCYIVTGVGGEKIFRTNPLKDCSSLPIEPKPEDLPGDFNCDGKVDVADYTVWRDTMGPLDCSYHSTGSDNSCSADANHDCVIDREDYFIWRKNYNRTSTRSK